MNRPNVPNLLVIRHGETAESRGGVTQGQMDTTLTPRGHLQAQAAGRFLANFGIALILSSDLRRCLETSAAIRDASPERPPIHPEPLLRELSLGSFEGRPKIDLVRFRKAARDSRSVRPPGGESLLELRSRVLNWLKSLPDTDRPSVVVTHQGPISVLFDLAEVADGEELASAQTHCGVTMVRKQRSKLEIIAVHVQAGERYELVTRT